MTSPSPSPLWPLRLALALRGLGIGFSYLWHDFERDSEIFGTLLFDWSCPEVFAQRFDDTGMWITALAAILILPSGWPGFQQYTAIRRLESVLLAFILIWEILLAAAITYRGGEFLSQLAIGAHGLRIGVPLALLIASHLTHSTTALIVVLRIATCLTFLTHGLQAIFRSPVFTTMLIGTAVNLFQMDLDQSHAESMLVVIGVIDILAALLVLGVRWQWLAFYMALWGLITACARTTSSSWGNYPETLLRLVHAGGPWWLYLEWSRRKSGSGSTTT